ncbi:YhcH/YjgK/YiaL family protein [Mailhella sp.]|uniref:YhcH/YjgK/YiaL family protein n=1 Tax=Mailhella sp. TaxID=1981029 RepID=UPI004062E3E7
MIIDTFERALSYDLGPLWERVLPEFLALYAQGDALALGRYELGDGVFVNVEEYAAKDWDVARYEGHENMADVQTLLSGEEYIDVMPLWKGVDVLGGEAERHDERDLIFYADKPAVPAVRFHLVPGMFALLLPGEAHQPCMKAGSERVKKLVIKIPAAGLKAPASV